MKPPVIQVLAGALAMVVLGGCARSITSTPGDAPDLEQYVKSIKDKKPTKERDPLPLLVEQQVFSYADHTTVTIDPNPQSALDRAAQQNKTATAGTESAGTDTTNPDAAALATTDNKKDAPVMIEDPAKAGQTDQAAPAVAESHPLRSPFDLPINRDNGASAIRPDSNRSKEALEGYPLDSLSMVGTLGKAPGMVALVMSPDKVTYRVAVGQYLGQQDGRVTDITETSINLVEIVPDGAGGWVEQPASIALSE